MKDQQSVAKGGPSEKKDKAPVRIRTRSRARKNAPIQAWSIRKNSKKGAKIAKIPPLTKAGQGEKKH
jgi:hypothetical protein